MITFSNGDRGAYPKGNRRFNFRVAGIAIDDDYVLLHRAERDSFWTFPGGRAEIGETSAQTLVREIKEELNENVEVIRLLWLVENFFEYDRQHYHEIAFYFLMRFQERSPYLVKDQSFWGVEEGTKMEFKWFPIDFNVLKQLPLLPSFLQKSLSNLPTSVEHIIQRDR